MRNELQQQPGAGGVGSGGKRRNIQHNVNVSNLIEVSKGNIH
jgi:hypothetical protein